MKNFSSLLSMKIVASHSTIGKIKQENLTQTFASRELKYYTVKTFFGVVISWKLVKLLKAVEFFATIIHQEMVKMEDAGFIRILMNPTEKNIYSQKQPESLNLLFDSQLT